MIEILNTFWSNVKMKNKNKPNIPGKNAMRVLRCGLPLISTVLIFLAIDLHNTAIHSPVTALITYPDMLSKVLASLLLLVFSALIFDIIELG